ncbi:MAG: tRNA (adenosine(37)-N6)-threonylcarbamoyltransferase complex ATPase subunit type 1 TsaE [Desulfococcaceae bacterium]|jgi:tRNA threonylcarbamoyladenosine biosynthesis protein TsaE|nr:tRNA (adenosine(37)-N6)-threonylcarbamoyltransferase complex ATPase subunit type 1 TsaE [Desulfococcaceae bacterium]
MIEIISRSPAQTEELGKITGNSAEKGIVLAMTGDLGSGKTVFVRGLARGLGVPAAYTVNSPTYTLINEYPGKYPLFHIDLYRLESGADFEDIGLYDILEEEGIAAVEWADRLYKNCLTDYLAVHFEISPPGIFPDILPEVQEDSRRKITMIPYGLAAENLIHRIKKNLKEQQWV